MLTGSSAASATLLQVAYKQGSGGARENSYSAILSSQASIASKVIVDWETEQAKTTPFTFGSNDYEITIPEKAADPVYQSHLAKLGIGLIRVCHAGLSDRWSDPATKTWDKTKIKAGYDASYPQRPTIIQNISGWPQWMKQDGDGLLDPSEYDRYY